MPTLCVGSVPLCASSAFSWIELIHIRCVGSLCFQQTGSKNEIRQRNSAIPPCIMPVTHSSCSSECSKSAHPLVYSVLLGAWLGKLRSSEQTLWRYLACSGSLLDLQTGLQPPRYCKTNRHKMLHYKLCLLVLEQLHVVFKRELRSYNCKILLGPANQLTKKLIR